MTYKRRNLLGKSAMLRKVLSVIVLAAVLSATATLAAPAHKKKRIDRHWHGYGFLPRLPLPARTHRLGAPARPRPAPYYGYGPPITIIGPAAPAFTAAMSPTAPFGPCWHANAPIGPMWNCGQ